MTAWNFGYAVSLHVQLVRPSTDCPRGNLRESWTDLNSAMSCKEKSRPICSSVKCSTLILPTLPTYRDEILRNFVFFLQPKSCSRMKCVYSRQQRTFRKRFQDFSHLEAAWLRNGFAEMLLLNLGLFGCFCVLQTHPLRLIIFRMQQQRYSTCNTIIPSF